MSCPSSPSTQTACSSTCMLVLPAPGSVLPAERDPQAYWPMGRFHVATIDAERRLLLRTQF